MFQTSEIESKIIRKHISSIEALQICLDLLMLSGAFGMAYLLRFYFALPSEVWQTELLQLLTVVPFQFLALRFCGIHKFIWRFVSLSEMNRIARALFFAALPLLVWRIVFPVNSHPTAVPLSIILLDFFLATTGILGIRLIRREVFENTGFSKSAATPTEKKSVLLIGAGRAGVMTLAELKTGRNLNYDLKGFIDDDSYKLGSVINGVTIIGKTKDIPRIVRELKIDHVIITIAQASRFDMRRIINVCESVPVKVKTIPGLSKLLEENVIVSRIRNVEVEDLLGRLPIKLDRQSIEFFLSSKTVLITGARLVCWLDRQESRLLF